MIGHTITRESGIELSRLLKKDRYQEPLERDTNTRPQGGGASPFFRFTLNEDMGASTANQADADILKLDGTDTGKDADVLDPIGLFSSLTNGQAGYCVKSKGVYYVVAGPNGTSSVLAKIFQAPSGGVPARSGTTLGSASCVEWTISSGVISAGSSDTVYNLASSAIAGDAYIIANLISAHWVAVMEDCG